MPRTASFSLRLAFALLVAAPAVALAGAATTAELEPNGNAATATALASGAVGLGNVHPDNDVDYWKFTATAGDRVYAAVVTGLSASQATNSKLTLYSTNGTTMLESDDDDGTLGALASSIAGKALPATGTYYLRVEYTGSSQLRPYRLYLQVRSGAPAAETEPNDDEAQALPGSRWVSGSIAGSDVDRFSIALAAGDTLYLGLDLDPERDNVDFAGAVALGSFGGATITRDDAGGVGPDSEALVVTVRDAATYTIEVEPTGAEGGTYHLSATVLPAAAEGTSCATYSSTDVPKAIPTGPGGITSTLVVPGNPRIADLDVSIVLDHADPDHLDVHLLSPAGNDNGLFTDIGSPDHPSLALTLDDEAPFPIGVFPVSSGLVLAPENAVTGDSNPTPDSFRLGWFDGEDAGGTWTLAIHDDEATIGGTLQSWSLRICQPLPEPACAAGYDPVTLYDSDFEAGDAGGFTHTGLQDEWQYGTPSLAPIASCASGTGCWKTDLDGTYNANSDQSLYSPAIDLGGGLAGPVVVRWSQRYQMEGADYDGYSVVAQESGGASPATLFQWLDGTMDFTAGATSIDASAGWGVFVRTLPASHLGRTIELRFRLTSDHSVQMSGVAIDDVSVSACQSSSADLLFADGFESGNTSAWSAAVP